MSFKTRLYRMYWLWKNRKWTNTRQKRRAMEQAIIKYTTTKGNTDD